jgi:protein transport protein SEC24
MRLRSPPGKFISERKFLIVLISFLALSIHTFYGSGFVRSVDLLVLPNINPDAAFGVQVAIEDSLTNYTSVTFQAALLYTSSKSKKFKKMNS